MRLRREKNLEQKLENIEYLIEAEQLGQLAQLFEKTQPLFLEIGMGKGGFLLAHASSHTHNNYLGIDKSNGIVLKASRTIGEQPNLKVLIGDFEELQDKIPAQSISGIFLNFSDPWPKKKHHKRRLTHRRFLDYYDRILKPGGTIFFKTDGEELFEFTLEEFRETGRDIYDVSRDVTHDPLYRDNIQTEYEAKFADQGKAIYGMKYRKHE